MDSFLPFRQLADLTAELDALDSVSRAPPFARRLHDFLLAMAGKGIEGLVMTRLISAGNDRLVRRVIELTAQRHRLPPVAWCWLALGSEGRQEQTLVTDQDNGLVFNAADDREAEALRALFLPFAQEVNRNLADCGFPLCRGQIMAGNPAWCLSSAEWRERFVDWVRRPDPEALLNASIFFDLRPLFGSIELGEQLRAGLLALTSDTPSFLHLMAANALQAAAPLNFRGDVVLDAGGEIDLKKYGSRIFVDAARIFALAAAAPAVQTVERLQQAGLAAGLVASEIVSAAAAFSHVLRLRLEQQRGDLAGGREGGAGLRWTTLHEVDRAILREVLKQAKRLQLRLKLNYSL